MPPTRTFKRYNRSKVAGMSGRRRGAPRARIGAVRRVVRRTRTRAGAAAGGRSDGIQRFNLRGTRTFTVNRTTVLGTITTSPAPIPVLYTPSSTTTPLFALYTDQFTKYRVNSIKMRFELTTFEQTDDSIMPTIYIRAFQDPDFTTATMTATSMMLQTGTIKKTFTAGSNVLEFTMRPMIMYAGLQQPAGTYKPMPRRMGYIDSTQDVTMWGVQYYVSAAGANQVILITAEWNTTWSNPK